MGQGKLIPITMIFKNIVRELKEGIDYLVRKREGKKHFQWRRGRAHVAPEAFALGSWVQDSQWANMPPELLIDIILRVEATQTSWPARKDVVACASVCRSWRSITKEIVETPERCGFLTFPISLKQPGPRDLPIQCFIRRDRASSTFGLFYGLSPGDANKLLLVARKIKRATCTELAIFLATSEFSRTSTSYIGKLRSNFLGTKFAIYERSHPTVNTSNYNVANISYELSVRRTRGPRIMQCNLHTKPVSMFPEDSTSCFGEKRILPIEKMGSGHLNSKDPLLILRNKAPRWHEHLQCWCLNFKGRVTVASVKNFQLVVAASGETETTTPAAENDNVILQFGKIAKDTFTMDYGYPLSAFQAFAICLSSFDTKPT